MSKTRLLLSAALGALLLSSPAAFAQSTTDKVKTEVKEDYNKVKTETKEGYTKAKSEITAKKVQLSEVPAPAMAAGKSAIPSTTISEAKQSTENGATVYDLAGRDSAKKKHSVHVTADGKVLRKD